MILKYICQIIEDYMELSPGQVWLKNEKYPLPFERTFSISVGFSGIKPIGIKAESEIVTDGSTVTQSETVSTTTYGLIAIDIMGRSFDVYTRHGEILQSVNSQAAQEMAQRYGFKIGRHPISVKELSGLDGPAIPYRFQIIFAVHFIESKTKTIDNYYDTFFQPEITYDAT